MNSVLVLHPSDEWYGADVMLFRTVEALIGSGQRPVVWLPKDVRYASQKLSLKLTGINVPVENHDLPVLRRSALRPSTWRRLSRDTIRLYLDLKRIAPTTILVNTSALSLCVAISRAAKVPKTVVHVHERLQSRESVALGLLMRGASKVIAISNGVERSLPRRLRARATIILDGVADPGSRAQMPSGPQIRFLFIGRWTPRKGLRELAAAWTYLDPCKYHLTIAGGYPPTGPRAVVDLAAISSRPNVRVVGEIANTGSLIDESHVIVVPSQMHEGLGLVAVEALSRGRPVLCTNVDGLNEVVDERVGWFLPVNGSAKEWADTIRQLTIHEVTKKSVSARTKYLQLFDLKTYSEKIRAEFTTTCAEDGP